MVSVSDAHKNSTNVHVLLACDHPLVRHALGALLRRQSGVRVVAETAVSAALADAARTHAAQIVLLTVDDAGQATSTMIRNVYAGLGSIPVVLLNLSDDDDRLLAALSLGVRGIIDRNVDGPRLLESLRDVLSGEVVLSQRLASHLVGEYVASLTDERTRGLRPAQGSGTLSDREREVLSRLARGETNRLIGDAMLISIHTVRAHVRSVMQKLRVTNRVQAATYAFEHGLLDQSSSLLRGPSGGVGGR